MIVPELSCLPLALHSVPTQTAYRTFLGEVLVFPVEREYNAPTCRRKYLQAWLVVESGFSRDTHCRDLFLLPEATVRGCQDSSIHKCSGKCPANLVHELALGAGM
jgi:hypothetical protein